jgi:hypothetical protein
MPTNRPVWSADCPVSMPEPADEVSIVPMYGFAMTQYRLVHDLSRVEYADLRVPICEPHDPSRPEVRGDAAANRLSGD